MHLQCHCTKGSSSMTGEKKTSDFVTPEPQVDQQLLSISDYEVVTQTTKYRGLMAIVPPIFWCVRNQWC